MRSGILTIAFFIIIGVIIANIIANPTGSKVVLDWLGSMWHTSVNGLRSGNAVQVQ